MVVAAVVAAVVKACEFVALLLLPAPTLKPPALCNLAEGLDFRD